MNPLRGRSIWIGGLFCLGLLVLLTQFAVPPAAEAVWSPQIAKQGPKDPGTPFEEPEGDPGSGGGEEDPKPPEQIGGGQIAPTTDAGANLSRAIAPQSFGSRLLLQPVVWRLQLLFRVKL